MHKAGFISIIGNPNAGKSTLLNTLLGQKISIVTPKVQTTRHRILGILSDESYQMVFVDTPGIITPRYGLHRAMMDTVNQALKEADVVLLMLALDELPKAGEAAASIDPDLLHKLQHTRQPLIVVLNKADLSDQATIEAHIAALRLSLPNMHTVIPVSALLSFNLDALKAALLDALPESPAFYDKDQITDRSERFIVSEIIREKIFLRYQQEIPYSTEVTILQFEEKTTEAGMAIAHIEAEIHVERASQKGILIGTGGSMLKKIGTDARIDIEKFLQRKAFLKLYVRLAEDWKDKPLYLKNFGYRS